MRRVAWLLFAACAAAGCTGRAPSPVVELPAVADGVLALSTVVLAPETDTAPDGDLVTAFPVVSLTGRSEPGATVDLVGGTRRTTADQQGVWRFDDLALMPGTNELTLRFSEQSNNRSADRALTVTRVLPDEDGNAVLDWNAEALDVIRKERLFPPPGSRMLAILHLAIADAAEGVPAPSRPAAVGAAARQVLATMFLAQAKALDRRLALTLEELPDSTDRDQAVAFGTECANRWLAARAEDGSTQATNLPMSMATGPGKWRPTRPVLRPPLLPGWGSVAPFAMTSADQFRLAPPPALDSAEFAESVASIRGVGEYFSATRTADQSAIARFWACQLGTASPPGTWNMVAAQVAREKGASLEDCAERFAALNAALADAGIAVWECKYHYDFWRPITAISLLEENPDPQWTPFISTPPFPDYPSGHSTFSGAAAVVLDDWFGKETSFAIRSEGMPLQFGVPDFERQFSSFEAAAMEASMSRVYGGIHYDFSCHRGLTMGQEIGEWVLQRGRPRLQK
ncbi:phosphatase PAP2 family protein [bacterium]|nr:phosphatase PAP2 family protein [bacterium]